MRLQVAAEGLLALDRLEQSLEVAFAEAACAVALDHLEEKGGPVLRGLREDLEEVTVLVAIGQDAQPAQVFPVLTDFPDSILDVCVVRIRRREEDDAPLLKALDGAHDVVALPRDVLHAG